MNTAHRAARPSTWRCCRALNASAMAGPARIPYSARIEATGVDVATPNYGYEKRQKELAKKKKKEEKLRAKAERKTGAGGEEQASGDEPGDEPSAPEAQPPGNPGATSAG